MEKKLFSHLWKNLPR